MKKIFTLAVALVACLAAGAQNVVSDEFTLPYAEEGVIDVSGSWTETTSGWYYSSAWVTFDIAEAPITITQDGEDLTIMGLLGNTKNVLKAKISGNTITMAAGQTIYYDGYDWEFGYDSDPNSYDDPIADLVGSIDEDGNIVLNGINAWYSGYSYLWDVYTTLKRTGTGIQSTQAAGSKTVKFVKDGQIYIVKDGKTYTISGMRK